MEEDENQVENEEEESTGTTYTPPAPVVDDEALEVARRELGQETQQPEQQPVQQTPVPEKPKAPPKQKGGEIIAIELDDEERAVLDKALELSQRKPMTAEELAKATQGKSTEERQRILDENLTGKLGPEAIVPDIMGELLSKAATIGKETAHTLFPSLVNPPTEQENKQYFEPILGKKSTPIPDWYDQNTGRIPANKLEDYIKYENSAIPPAKKEWLTSRILSAITELPPEEIVKGRVLGNSSNSMAQLLQTMDGLFFQEAAGKYAAYGINKFIRETPKMPDNFFSPEEKAYIQDNLHNGGSIATNLFELQIPTDAKNVDEAIKEMWNTYVGAARDVYFEVGKNKIAANAGLPFLFMGGKGIGAIANPLTAVAAKRGVKFTGQLVSSMVEGGLLQPPTEAEGKTWISTLTAAGFGGITHTIGALGQTVFSPKAGVDVDATPRQAAEIRKERAVVEAAPGAKTQDLALIARGDTDLPNVPEADKPALRAKAGEMAKGQVVKDVLEDKPITPETMEVLLNQGVRDPKVQEKLDHMMAITDGVTPQQKMADTAFKRTAAQMPKETAEIMQAIRETADYKLSLENPELMQDLMKRNNVDHAYSPFESELQKTASNKPAMYRQYLIESAKVLTDSLDETKLTRYDLSKSSSRTIRNLIEMQDNPIDFNTSTVNWRKLSSDLSDKVVQLSDTSNYLKKIDDPRMQFVREHIDQAVSNNRQIDRGFVLDELKKLGEDTGEVTLAKRMASQVLSYNNILNKMGEVKQDIQNSVAKTTFVNNAREAANNKTLPSETLIKAAGSSETPKDITSRFNEHINTAMQNNKIPVEVKRATDNFIKQSAINIASGMQIPKDFVDTFKMEIEKAKGVSGVNALRDVAGAVEHWNKEIEHIDTLKTALGQSYNNPSDLSKLIPAFQQASKDVITPTNLERLDTYHSYLSSVWTQALEGAGLPDKSKLQLFDYLFGGNEVKLKMEADPGNMVRTQEHAQNILDALTVNSAEVLNTLDDIHKEVLGIPLNREWFLANIATPMNDFNSGRAIEKLMLDSSFYKHAEVAREAKKNPDRAYLSALNSEMMDYEIVKKTNLSVLNDFSELQGFERLASQRMSDDFGGEIKDIEKQMKGRWGLAGFTELTGKLTGARGIKGLYDVMYLQGRDGSVKLTDIGRLTKNIFTSEKRFAEYKKIFEEYKTTNNTDKLTSFIEVAMQASGIEAAKIAQLRTKNFVNHFINYFSDPVLWRSHIDQNMWREGFEFLNYSTKARAKAWDVHEEVIAAHNEKYRHKDINLQPRKWREDYVTTRKENNVSLSDAQDSIYLTEDLSRRFGSSLTGQLDKANEIAINEMMHPARVLMQDLQAMVRDSHTAHSKAYLQEHGLLLQSLGYNAEAKAISEAIKREQPKIIEQIRNGLNQTNAYNFLQNFDLVGAAPLVNTIAKVMGSYLPQTMLNTPISLVKNLIQQGLHQASFTKNGGIALPNFFWSTFRSYLSNSYMPLASYITPASSKAVTRVGSLLKDNVKRSEMKFIDNFSRITNKPGGKSDLAGQAVEAITGMKPVSAMSPIAKGFRAVERAVDLSAEAVTGLLKERIESSMSKATLARGAYVMEKALGVYKKDGVKGMYEYLKPHFGSKTNAHVWNLAQSIDRISKEGGDPFATVIDDFILMYHDNAVGRFGPRNSPLMLNKLGLSTLAPSATRFLSARTNMLYRMGMTGSELKNAASNLFREHKIPPAIGGRIMWSMLTASGYGLATYMLYEGTDGILGNSIKDRNDMEQETVIRRMFRHGTGVDLTRVSPIDVKLVKDLTSQIYKGDLMGATGTAGTAFVDSSRQRGIPFAGPELMAVWKSLKTLNENTGDKIPVLSIMGSQLEAKQKTLNTLNRERARLEQIPEGYSPEQAKNLDDKITKMVEEVSVMRAKYEKSIYTGVADHLLNSFPPTAWISYGFHPFTVATSYLDARANEQLNRDKWEALAEDGSVGPLGLIQQFMGITTPGDKNIQAAQRFFSSYYKPLVDAGLVSAKQADYYAKQAYAYDAMLTELDADLNLLIQSENIPGKSSLEEIKNRVAPTMSIQAPEIYYREISPEEKAIHQKSISPQGGK
jgi:hypothetical protein